MKRLIFILLSLSMISLSNDINFNKGLECLEKKDLKSGEKYLMMSTEEGNPDAMYFLGAIYFVQEKYDLAEKYLKMSEEKGVFYAINNLAVVYEKEKHTNNLQYHKCVISNSICY